jgi:hypothetical protein
MAKAKKAKAAPKEKPAVLKPGALSVTFEGYPGGSKVVPEYHGVVFPKGKRVVITDDEWIKAHGDSIRRTDHFKVEG